MSSACRYKQHANSTAVLLGRKLYGNFRLNGVEPFLEDCAKHTAAVRMLSRECDAGTTWPACTPHGAMVGGLAALVRPFGRKVRVASQGAASVGAGGRYNVGVLNLHRPGSSYPLHFDAINANAWWALRKWLGAEQVELDSGFRPQAVAQFSVARHAFTTAAIFTVQSPDREHNPYDLRVYRARWQSLVGNCSVRSAMGYGLGQRLDEATFFPHGGVEHVDIRGDEGDLYIFNSEHAHTTPTIRGGVSRGVLASVLGLSHAEAQGDVEVWG